MGAQVKVYVLNSALFEITYGGGDYPNPSSSNERSHNESAAIYFF